MGAFSLFAFVTNSPETWIAAASGVGVASIAIFLGLRSGKRNGASTAPPQAEDKRRIHESLDLDPFSEGSPREKRQAPRRKGRQVEVDLAFTEEDNEHWEGWVADRSTTGLRIMSSQPVEVGATILVRVRNEVRFMPWLEIEVRRCIETKLGWELGCRFVHPPTYNVLLAFG